MASPVSYLGVCEVDKTMTAYGMIVPQIVRIFELLLLIHKAKQCCGNSKSC